MFDFNDNANFYSVLGAIGNNHNQLGTANDVVHDFNVNISRTLSEQELELLYLQSKLIQKIVDYYPSEAASSKLILKCDNNSVDLSKVLAKVDNLNILDLFKKASIEARIYGDAFLILGVNDGLDLDQEINRDKITKVEWIKQAELLPEFTDNYNDPIYYSFTTESFNRIHASRVLHFKGKELPNRLRIRQGLNRNQSTIEAIFLELCIYLNANKASSATLTRSNTFVYKMRNFAKRIAKVADIAERFSMLNASLSVLKGIVIDAESEEVQYVSQTLQGYKDLLDKFEDQFIAVSGYPRSKLLGSSNSSAFSEGGLSDRLEWAQLLQAYQINNWLPHLKRIMPLLLAELYIVDTQIDINFESVLVLSDLEQANLAKLRAETDAIYLANGVQTAQEIKDARFGGLQNTTIRQLN